MVGLVKAAIPKNPPESQRHASSCLATYVYMLAERWIPKKRFMHTQIDRIKSPLRAGSGPPGEIALLAAWVAE